MADDSMREWVLLELMGHRKLGGFITEQEVAGEGFLRIDVWIGDAEKPAISQLYSPKAVYCITPTIEEHARAFAARYMPQPVQRWELEPPRAPRTVEQDDEDDNAWLDREDADA